jgi:uncharacterized iron-regulated membrane protein
MTKNKFVNLNRKAHRYLGLIIGIQFLFWTIGGMYFAFSDIDEIHGDHQRKHVMLKNYDSIVSPSIVLQHIKEIYGIDSLESLKLISILDKPVYQIIYHHKHIGHMQMSQLADAKTGELLPPLTKEQGVALAQQHFNTKAPIKSVQFINEVNGHHEYREKPLPAWAITFEHTSNTTVYVAANLGTVQSFRNSKWRIFDFLWMLHTMDYENRDNFGNLLLRAFSIFGLATITSGFILFFSTRKKRTKKGMSKK